MTDIIYLPRAKQWVRLSLLAFVVFGSLAVIQKTWEKIPVISYYPSHSTESPPVIRLGKFHMVDMFQQKKRWELSALTAQSAEENADIVVLRGLEVTFFSSPSSAPITLLAQRGELNNTTRAIIVEGDVQLDNGRGYVLTTDSLIWDPRKQVLYTNDQVKIRGGGLEIEGRGFRSDATGREMKIQEEVRARIL